MPYSNSYLEDEVGLTFMFWFPARVYFYLRGTGGVQIDNAC